MCHLHGWVLVDLASPEEGTSSGKRGSSASLAEEMTLFSAQCSPTILPTRLCFRSSMEHGCEGKGRTLSETKKKEATG